MMLPPTAIKLRRALTKLEQWRNETRQTLIDSLDTDMYSVPDALVILAEAHEQAKTIIARYLLAEYQTAETRTNSDEPDEDDGIIVEK